jgi:hypothetical protein
MSRVKPYINPLPNSHVTTDGWMNIKAENLVGWKVIPGKDAPDWMDGLTVGEVVQYVGKHIFVRWEGGGAATRHSHTFGNFHLAPFSASEIDMTKEELAVQGMETKKNYPITFDEWKSLTPEETIGFRVTRSPDWKWGRQDGGVGSIGKVIGISTNDNWINIVWDNGTRNSYRHGLDSCYDVIPVTKSVKKTVSVKKSINSTKETKMSEVSTKAKDVLVEVAEVNKENAIVATRIVAGQTVLNRIKVLLDGQLPKEGPLAAVFKGAFGDLVISNILLLASRVYPDNDKLNSVVDYTNLAATVSTKDQLDVQGMIDGLLDGITLPELSKKKGA